MTKFLLFLLIFLHISIASQCSTSEVQEHYDMKKEVTREYNGMQIHVVNKRGGGGGGGHGGGGGGGGGGHGGAHGSGGGHGGGEGGRSRGRGGILPIYGAGGAAAAARNRQHQQRSNCPNAHFGLTLPLLLSVLGIHIIHFGF